MEKEKIKKRLVYLTWTSIAIAISQIFITKRGGIKDILVNIFIPWLIWAVVVIVYTFLTEQRSTKQKKENQQVK